MRRDKNTQAKGITVESRQIFQRSQRRREKGVKNRKKVGNTEGEMEKEGER